MNEITEKIFAIYERAGKKKAETARTIGCSHAFVSKVINKKYDSDYDLTTIKKVRAAYSRLFGEGEDDIKRKLQEKIGRAGKEDLSVMLRLAEAETEDMDVNEEIFQKFLRLCEHFNDDTKKLTEEIGCSHELAYYSANGLYGEDYSEEEIRKVRLAYSRNFGDNEEEFKQYVYDNVPRPKSTHAFKCFEIFLRAIEIVRRAIQREKYRVDSFKRLSDMCEKALSEMEELQAPPEGHKKLFDLAEKLGPFLRDADDKFIEYSHLENSFFKNELVSEKDRNIEEERALYELADELSKMDYQDEIKEELKLTNEISKSLKLFEEYKEARGKSKKIDPSVTFQARPKQKTEPGKNKKEIPVIDAIAAGTFDPQHHGYDKTLDLSSLGIEQDGHTFAFEVIGDSMQNFGIHNGDYAIVRKTPYPKKDQIVCAVLDGSMFTLKKYRKVNGEVYLEAGNGNQPDLIPTEELQIQGVLIGVYKNFE